MLLIDVHAHLDHEAFAKDLDSVIENAKKAGVKSIITNGINKKTNRITLELAQKYDIVRPALGIYPLEWTKEEAGFDVDEELAFIEEHAQVIAAIGEVGLDYKWVTDRNEEQKEVFQKVIDRAKKLKKTLIIHSRKAEGDVIDMLEASGVKKAVLHCFGGNFKLVKRAVELGLTFSIPAVVVRDQHFQKIVQEVPCDQLLTETDAPYLGPVRDERNEPATVAQSIHTIAQIKGITIEEMQNIIFKNYQNLFL